MKLLSMMGIMAAIALSVMLIAACGGASAPGECPDICDKQYDCAMTKSEAFSMFGCEHSCTVVWEQYEYAGCDEELKSYWKNCLKTLTCAQFTDASKVDELCEAEINQMDTCVKANGYEDMQGNLPFIY